MDAEDEVGVALFSVGVGRKTRNNEGNGLDYMPLDCIEIRINAWVPCIITDLDAI